MATIRGLILWRPWDWAFIYAGKDVENRTWTPTLKPGDYIALHSGKRWDDDAADFIYRIRGAGFIVPADEEWPVGSIVAVARYDGVMREGNSPWFVGPVGWKMPRTQKIEPVPFRGAQGLWPLPEDVLQQVRANFQAAVMTAQTYPTWSRT